MFWGIRVASASFNFRLTHVGRDRFDQTVGNYTEYFLVWL